MKYIFIIAILWAGQAKAQTFAELKAIYQPQLDSIKGAMGKAYGNGLYTVSDVNYTITDTVGYVLYTSLTADRTLTLPSAATYPGRTLIITHGGTTNNILFNTNVRQGATITVGGVSAGNAIQLKAKGTEWMVIKL